MNVSPSIKRVLLISQGEVAVEGGADVDALVGHHVDAGDVEAVPPGRTAAGEHLVGELIFQAGVCSWVLPFCWLAPQWALLLVT